MSNTNQNIVSGTILYAKVTEPSYKYQSETDQEFSIDIVVTEDEFDNFGERYPKQRGKAVKTSEFEGIYKIPPVYSSEKKQYILKLKKAATFNNKVTGALEVIPRKYWPKVLVQKGNKAVSLEAGVLVANGSVGKVSFEENANSFGTFAKLKNILITDLIEYKKEGSDAANDFGLSTDIEGSSDFEEVPKVEVKPKTPVKPTMKRPVVEPEDMENSPF